jgi:hypothetical protein
VKGNAGDKGVALGVGGALAVCCAVHLIVLAGGIGAVSGTAGGLLANPYLIVAGLMLVALSAAVLMLRRVRCTGDGCGAQPPDTGTETSAEPAERRETSSR